MMAEVNITYVAFSKVCHMSANNLFSLFVCGKLVYSKQINKIKQYGMLYKINFEH